MSKAIGKALMGGILKGIRTKNGLGQREVAVSLEYENANFISMLESGLSSPPITRIPDLPMAYQADEILTAAIVKATNPDCWHLLMAVIKSLPENIDLRNEKAITKVIDKWTAAQVAEHGVDPDLL